jgi:hypothetical protein
MKREQNKIATIFFILILIVDGFKSIKNSLGFNADINTLIMASLIGLMMSSFVLLIKIEKQCNQQITKSDNNTIFQTQSAQSNKPTVMNRQGLFDFYVFLPNHQLLVE